MERTYTQMDIDKRYTHGRDIYTEAEKTYIRKRYTHKKIYIRRGYTYKEDIHMEEYTKETYTWRRHIQKGIYT